MGRPKGSKNKASKPRARKPRVFNPTPEIVTPVIVDPIEDELDYEAKDADVLEEELVNEGEDYDFDEDIDEDISVSSPPPGMSLDPRLETPVPDADPDRNVAERDLIGAIKEQTDTLTRMMPPKKVHISQFKGSTAFNPTGVKRKLKSAVFQNGYRVGVATLHDTEIALINSKRLKPGQFINKLVTIRREIGSGGGEDKIFISYDNHTVDQRMTLQAYWSNFEDLLTKCIVEAESRKSRLIARRRAELR